MQAGVVKPGPLMEGLVPVRILGCGPGQITVLELDGHCAMLREASLWCTTQLKTSRFFWRHLQQPCPKCINSQMIRTSG